MKNETVLKSNKIMLWFCWLLIIAGALYLLLRGITDTDVYYLLANGKYILSHGIPKINPFITTPNQNIVIQNWLYDVIIAFINNKFNAIGLYIFGLIQLSIMTLLILKFLDYKKSTNQVLVSISTLLVILIFSFINLRPEMITFILVLTEILILEKFRDNNRAQLLYLLPFLTLLEINVHASYWIMHFVVMLPYIVPAIPIIKTSGQIKFLKQLLIPSVLMTGSLFINPYGIDSITYVFKAFFSGSVSSMEIMEQQSPALNRGITIIFIMAIACFTFLWYKQKMNSADIYMFLGFSVLYIMQLKWTSFYAISLMFLLRRSIDYIKENNIFRFNIKPPKIFTIAFIPVVCIYLFFGAYFITNISELTTDNYMNSAQINYSAYVQLEDLDIIADYLDEHDTNVSICAGFTSSNYFEYRGYKIVMDARPELYEKSIAGSDEVIDTFLKIYRYKSFNNVDDYISYEDYQSNINSLNVDYFVVDNSEESIKTYLNSYPQKYKIVCATDTVTLFSNL